MWHTTDGGQTWQEQVSSFLDLQDIHFSDLLHGIAVGGVDGNATLLTDDGGVTWTQQSNPEGAYLNGVRFSDPLTGIAVGQGIFRTYDGAATWQRDFSYSLYFQDICLMGDGVALAVGGGGSILRAGPDGVGLVYGGYTLLRDQVAGLSQSLQSTRDRGLLSSGSRACPDPGLRPGRTGNPHLGFSPFCSGGSFGPMERAGRFRPRPRLR